jgi:hypothetical protein
MDGIIYFIHPKMRYELKWIKTADTDLLVLHVSFTYLNGETQPYLQNLKSKNRFRFDTV